MLRIFSFLVVVVVLVLACHASGILRGPTVVAKDDDLPEATDPLVKALRVLDRQIRIKETELAELKRKADALRSAIEKDKSTAVADGATDGTTVKVRKPSDDLVKELKKVEFTTLKDHYQVEETAYDPKTGSLTWVLKSKQAAPNDPNGLVQWVIPLTACQLDFEAYGKSTSAPRLRFFNGNDVVGEPLHPELTLLKDGKDRYQRLELKVKLTDDVRKAATHATHERDITGAYKPRADTKLDIRHVENRGSFLRLKLPTDIQADDQLVLVYVDPKSGKAANELILVPEGKVEDGVRESLKTWKALGLEAGEVHQPGTTFNNGSFDLVATANSHKKVGVYAFAWVSLKNSERPIGTSTTYFALTSWASDKVGEVEIPLPNKANESREEYIPRTCDLSVWVIARDGKKRAQGDVKVKRD